MKKTGRLICPYCKTTVQENAASFFCPKCSNTYPVIANIPSFISRAPEDRVFTEEMFKTLSHMESGHFWQVGRREVIFRMLESFTKDKGPFVFLELGCGNGSIVRYLETKGVAAEGADLSLEALRRCRRSTGSPLYHTDIFKTPFQDASYDAIGLFDVLEHVDDEAALLREAFRICKIEGFLIVTVPAGKKLWSGYDTLAGHKRRYEKRGLVEKLEVVGFTVKKASFFMMILSPIVWLMRRAGSLKYYKNGKMTDSFEFKTVPVLNGILLSLLRIENYFMARTGLPFGSSLICIAKKQAGSEACRPDHP